MSDFAALKALSLPTKALIIVNEFEQKRMPMFQMRSVLAALLKDEEEKKAVIDLIERELSAAYPPERVGEFLTELISVSTQPVAMNDSVQSTRRLRSPFVQGFDGGEVAQPMMPQPGNTQYVPRGQVYPAVPSNTMMLRNNGQPPMQQQPPPQVMPLDERQTRPNTLMINRGGMYPPPQPGEEMQQRPRGTMMNIPQPGPGLTQPNPNVIRSGPHPIRPDGPPPPPPQQPQAPTPNSLRQSGPIGAPQRRGTFVFDQPLAGRGQIAVGGGQMPPPEAQPPLYQQPPNTGAIPMLQPEVLRPPSGFHQVGPVMTMQGGNTPPPSTGESRPTILIADDDKRIRMVFRLRMEESGLSVVECSDGTEAWERIQAGDISLAVLDMKMPGLHGLEVLSRMSDKQFRIPVIVCSAYDQLKDEFVVQTYPTLKYLVKPVAPETLVGTIKELLVKQSA